VTTATSSAAGRADTEALLSAAVAGDAQAFRLLTAPYRRELLVHCYRMLGSLDDAADLVARYVQAWHAQDVPSLVALLREDASMAMPPTPSWYQGRDHIAIYLRRVFTSPLGCDLRLVPTGANGQAALAVYAPTGDGDGYQPFAIKVLTVNGGLIVAITGFVYPGLFGRFALPPRLPDAAGGIISVSPRQECGSNRLSHEPR
jgi:ketosteroid isomerase-like protein